MKQTLFSILFLFLATSCQFFETKKISSETFLEEEIKSINWQDVDSYPVFKKCETITGKLETKTCFESTLSNHLHQTISSEKMIVTSTLNDTILINFMVSVKGELVVTAIAIDSVLQSQLPLLKPNIIRGLDSLQLLTPAYKRGIPVRTTFKLPIVIKTNS